MAVREILVMGNPKLREVCEPVARGELKDLLAVVADMHDTLLDYRNRNGTGRAIAAPQIGVLKRLVYMFTDTPTVFINPRLENFSKEMIELWDDCLSLPDLRVKVNRHKSCRIVYRDLDWVEYTLDLDGDLSELLQHECDHLDGILAVARAIDGQSIAYKSEWSKYKS